MFSRSFSRFMFNHQFLTKSFTTAPPAPQIIDCVLLSKEKVNHDSYIYKFNFKDPQASLVLAYGQHVKMMADLKTPESPEKPVPVSRRYTPISDVSNTKGFDLLLKIYRKTEKFPFGGLMTQYLESLNIGDIIKVSGPEGKFRYKGAGEAYIGNELRKIKTLGLIAGGSGITPMFQLIKGIGEDPLAQTQITLLYANKTEDDILMKRELTALQQKKPYIWRNTLEKTPPGWKDFQGFITKDMLHSLFPAPSPETLICMCGPQPMNKMVLESLVAMGYTTSNLFKF